MPGLEPGSFRDPDSRIVTIDGRILRLLSEHGLADWRELSASGLLDEQPVIGTREVLPMGSGTFRPGRVRIRIGAPIPTEGLPLHARAELTRCIRERISGLLTLSL